MFSLRCSYECGLETGKRSLNLGKHEVPASVYKYLRAIHSQEGGRCMPLIVGFVSLPLLLCHFHIFAIVVLDCLVAFLSMADSL